MEILIEKGRHWLQMNERESFFRNEIIVPEGFQSRTVGSSEPIMKVNKLVRRVAPTDATVLITGESGTGKELIAADIFRLSDPNGTKPYIKMNCAAVPETLLESELFGHEKGAFTGASERRIGRFELADGGSLLLDEIGEIPPAMQSKLLRVLQESEFERVGGAKTVKVNVRVITTTNRNLKKEVADGTFREDLFYRLNVFPIELPPLRERGRDCLEIAEYFLDIQKNKLGRELKFDSSARDLIMAYSWPGNIRELENVIERIAILEDGPGVGASAFPADITASASGASLLNPGASSGDNGVLDIKTVERATIKRALARTSGNKTRAAELLGISVRTLRNKINEYRNEGLLDEEFIKLLSID
jgi:transcriptional regulator with GAF, ATPase, and Fis domain